MAKGIKIHFKQAVHLDGKNYGRGTHEVPTKTLKHKFFAKLLRLGLVSDPESPPVEVVTDKMRQSRLAEKVKAHVKSARPMGPIATPNSAPPAPPVEVPAKDEVPAEEETEEPSDEFGESEDTSDESTESDEASSEEEPAEEPAEEPKLEEPDYAGKSKKKAKKGK